MYTSNFTRFDVQSILNPDLSLNEHAWTRAQPILLTPLFAFTYAASFAALSAILVHVWIWHRHQIWQALSKRTVHEDVHNKLMEAYEEVPSRWYLLTLAGNLVAATALVMVSRSVFIASSRLTTYHSFADELTANPGLVPLPRGHRRRHLSRARWNRHGRLKYSNR